MTHVHVLPDNPPYHMPIAKVLAARCARISVRVSLIGDCDVITDSVLITCPPNNISHYVSDAWLPSGPMHHLLSTREAEAVVLTTAFSV